MISLREFRKKSEDIWGMLHCKLDVDIDIAEIQKIFLNNLKSARKEYKKTKKWREDYINDEVNNTYDDITFSMTHKDVD